MDRKCKRLVASKDKKRAIYLDSINSKEIIEYFSQDNRHKKKLEYIIERLLEQPINDASLYCNVEINKGAIGVKELRLFVGQENDRIYCKEITDEKNNVRIIIWGILHLKKKSDELSSRERSSINTIGGYNYEAE